MKRFTSFVLVMVIIVCSVFVCVHAEDKSCFYVVLGDSIAYGSGLKNPHEACYGKIVADTNGYGYSNHAVPGSTSEELIAQLDNEAVISDIKKARIISISSGGNDFLKNNPSDLIFDAALEGNYSGFDDIAESFYDNLCIITDKINSLNSDAVILLQTLYNPQTGDLGDLYQYGVDAVNGMIIRYYNENPGEIEIIDVNSAFGGDLSCIAKDGIHPSAKGNLIIAQAVLNKLVELGYSTVSEPVVNEQGKDIRGSFSRNLAIRMLTFMVKILAFLYNAAI